MSFPRYERYKDSGVEWLGEVPEHWEITKTKHVTNFHTGWTPPTGKAESYEGDNLWANISDLGEKYLFDTSKRISDEAISSSRITLSSKGSLLFSFKLSIGQVSFAGNDMYTNEAIATFPPSDKIDGIYSYYALPIFLVKNAAENIYGAKLLNQELIRSAVLALPCLEEQQTIATFLDRETAKIDALIAEQQRLIDLLKEKRQAVISHAVTKGLNSDAPMKDSGIEWLGEVPEHWEVKRLKHIGNAQIGLTYDPADVVAEGEGVIVLRSSNVQEGRIVFNDNVYVKKEIPDKLVTIEGDILICSRNGSRALIGKNAMIENDASGLTFGAFMTIFRSGINIYLRWIFNSRLFEFQSGSFLTSTINQLTVGNLYGFDVPLPPPQEQKAIAAFLDHETAKLDALTAEAQTAIGLLQERRTALISAAVTGKIDVRGFASDSTH